MEIVIGRHGWIFLIDVIEIIPVQTSRESVKLIRTAAVIIDDDRESAHGTGADPIGRVTGSATFPADTAFEERTIQSANVWHGACSITATFSLIQISMRRRLIKC